MQTSSPSNGDSTTRESEAHLLKDLVLTFQGASQALEKSYGDLQERVRFLSEDLERASVNSGYGWSGSLPWEKWRWNLPMKFETRWRASSSLLR